MISDCLRRPQFVKLYNFLCSLEYLGGLKINQKKKWDKFSHDSYQLLSKIARKFLEILLYVYSCLYVVVCKQIAISCNYNYGPVKVNQKWLFSGSSLETQQIKNHFWVRNWDFLLSILFSVFNSKLRFGYWVLLPAEKSELNLSLSLPVRHCKLLTRAQTQTLKLGFKPEKMSGSQTQNFKPENCIFWFTLTGTMFALKIYIAQSK